ncbi:MAG: hypothetical protein FWF75_02750 [Propionibacteriaceae bacterium]|nr:hypothetical protein [Propionibacteriaceae bacterium]
MPNGNGGEVSPVDCARGLAELDLLSDAIAGQPGCFLVDNRIGLEVYDYVGAADDATTFLGTALTKAIGNAFDLALPA